MDQIYFVGMYICTISNSLGCGECHFTRLQASEIYVLPESYFARQHFCRKVKDQTYYVCTYLVCRGK